MRGARVRAGTSASSANASPLARMGTKDTAAGSNPSTYNQLNNPNVEPATPTKSRTAAQAARNAGVGHAQNGLPMAPLGRAQATRTKGLLAITRPEHICSRNTGQGNTGVGHATTDQPIGTFGRDTNLSDQVNGPRAARAGDKVLDAQAQLERPLRPNAFLAR
jgi:hypothetical protein